MLKRNQVLPNDWMVVHTKAIAKKYGISFSEVIRLRVCLQASLHITTLYPEYKCKIKSKTITNIIHSANKKEKSDPKDLHKFLSDVYFESRKAMEFWANKEEKKNTKPAKKAKGG